MSEFGARVMIHELTVETCAERKVAIAIDEAGVPRTVVGEIPASHVCTAGCERNVTGGKTLWPERPVDHHEEVPVRKAGLFF